MRELSLGEPIEANYVVHCYRDNKEYRSTGIKIDGSYIMCYFRHFSVHIPRVYTKDMITPDEYGIYFKVFAP